MTSIDGSSSNSSAAMRNPLCSLVIIDGYHRYQLCFRITRYSSNQTFNLR